MLFFMEVGKGGQRRRRPWKFPEKSCYFPLLGCVPGRPPPGAIRNLRVVPSKNSPGQDGGDEPARQEPREPFDLTASAPARKSWLQNLGPRFASSFCAGPSPRFFPGRPRISACPGRNPPGIKTRTRGPFPGADFQMTPKSVAKNFLWDRGTLCRVFRLPGPAFAPKKPNQLFFLTPLGGVTH